MTSLDDLLRDTFAERAHDVDGLTLTAPTTRPRRAGRWTAVATVVAFAAAIVVTVVLVAPWRDRARPVPQPASPPAGTQWVSYHGITLTVPVDWATGMFVCTRPDRSAVQIGQWSGASCPFNPDQPETPADATVLYLGDLQLSAPMGDPTTVAGQPARRFVNDGGPGESVFTEVQLLTPGVDILITGPVAPADELLAGLRYTPVDDLGCAATITADPIPADTPAGRVVLPTPVAVTVCDYAPVWGQGGYLLGSRVLTADERTALVTAVHAAPPWTDPPDDHGQQLQGDSLVYRLTLPDGSTRTVGAQAFGPAYAVSDGERRAALPFDSHLAGAWS